MKSKNKIKVIIAIPSLCAGGAERVMSFVANELDTNQFDTTLVNFGFQKDNAYEIEGVKVVYFNKPRVLSGIPQFFNFIRKNKPHIVLTAIGHLNTIGAYFSLFFWRTKFIIREVNVLSVLAQFHGKSNKLFSILAKRRFKMVHAVICQSQDMKNDLIKSYNISDRNLVVINNPITNNFSVKKRTSLNKKVHFITVARLVKQKGHERLFNALAKLDFDFKYTIVGDGTEKEYLVRLAKKLRIFSKIEFVSFTKEVDIYLAKADIYLQCSYVEGFPNALLESLMVGTPAIAFDAPGGINELIIQSANGYIAKNEKEYIDFIELMIREGIPSAQNVSDSVHSRYNKEIIIDQYQALFKELVS